MDTSSKEKRSDRPVHSDESERVVHNQPARDPDFEVQEAPDYSEKSSELHASAPPRGNVSGAGQPEPDRPTPSNPRILKEDKETLAIQKPIESLFEKEHSGKTSPPDEEIELPQKRWSGRQEKQMKKKAKYRQFAGDRPYSPGSSTQAPARSTIEIPPPGLVKEPPKERHVSETTQSLVPTHPVTPSKQQPILSDKSERAPVSPTVSHSKGIAYVDNSGRLKVSGGYRIYPGDMLKVGEQEFLVKQAKRNYTSYYIAGAATVLLLIILFSALFSSGAKNGGSLTGIVVEQNSRALVPEASVLIKELGLKVKSNELGFFNFQMVPQGTYTIEALVPGFTSASDQATVTRKKTTNLALVIAPVVALPSSQQIEEINQIYQPSSSASPETGSKNSAISIKTSPADALVLVDNRQLGKGSGTYQNIKPGTHTIRISKPGYKDWQKEVTVKSGQTALLQANLEKAGGLETGLTRGSFEDYLAAAEAAYQNGDYPQAVGNYSQAAKISARPEVYLGRGMALAQTGNKNDASNDFLAAADMYLQSEKYSKTAEAYSYYLELNPHSDKIRYERGKAYLAAGNYREAAEDIKKSLESTPKFVNGLLDLGKAYYYAGDYQNSVDAYLKAKKVNPMDKRIYVGLAQSYAGLNDRKECKNSYDKFKELASYVDKERMREDPDWQKVLSFLQIKPE